MSFYYQRACLETECSVIATAEWHVRKLDAEVGVSAVREGEDGQRHRSGLAQLGPEPLCDCGSEHQSCRTGGRSLHRLDRGEWDQKIRVSHLRLFCLVLT